MEQAAAEARTVAAATGRFAVLVGELDRRQGWRTEGATSLEAWIAERTGASVATARSLTQVAGRLFELPHLSDALTSGELSFDKVRAVADVATPETDAELAQTAATLSVRELIEVARSSRRPGRDDAKSDYEARSVRCNDTFRTITAQLPPPEYAELRAAIEARAEQMTSEEELRWDQRMADALVSLIRSAKLTWFFSRRLPPQRRGGPRALRTCLVTRVTAEPRGADLVGVQGD